MHSGGTRAGLGVLFVLPSVSLALGHYSSDHSSEGLLGDRPRSGAGLGRMGSGHSPVRVYPRMSRMEASTVPRGRLSSSSSSSPAATAASYCSFRPSAPQTLRTASGRLRGLRLPLVAHSALELRVRVQLYDDVAALRRGEGDRVRRFAVVLLLRVDERVVAHLSLVVSEDGLCAALGGADAREVPPERHAFRRCLNGGDGDLYEVFLSHPVCFLFLFSLQHPLFSSLFSWGNHQIFRALSRV